MKTSVLLLPFCCHLLSAQNTCAISGTAVDATSGRPVSQVKVFAGSPNASDQDNAPPAMRRITNLDGQFCFERLSAGNYKITAQKAGYLDATYGEQHADSPGLPVAVTLNWPAGPPIILKIVPQTTISGTVTDADGDPISHVRIILWKRSLLPDSPSNPDNQQTDDQGRFRFWGVAPGTYYISASPSTPAPVIMNRAHTLDGSGHPLRELEVETFYKGALTRKNATPIVVKAEQEVTGIALAIQKGVSRHITGRVSGDVQSGERPMVSVWMPGGSGFGVAVENDGRFHVEGLAPGQYSLNLLALPGRRVSTRKAVDLTDGDADGIVLESRETLEIKASAHLDGSKVALPLVDSELVIEKEGAYSAAQADDGTWHFSELAPDIYRIVLWSNPEHYFVKRVIIDGSLTPET